MDHTVLSPKRLAALSAIFLTSLTAFAQGSFWSENTGRRSDSPTIEVSQFKTYNLDVQSLEQWLSRAPQGAATEARNSSLTLTLPMPDGTMEEFMVVNSPIMAPALARKFPEIQVFAGQGVTHPEFTVRFDLTPQGFHAMILAEGETVYIDPYRPNDRETVIVYTRSDFYASTSKQMSGCIALEAPGSKPSTVTKDVEGGKQVKMMGGSIMPQNRVDNGANLRTYRLALACTGEYAQFHGGTVSSVLAAMNTSMARVNGLFERDVCLTMELVPNNDQLIFLNGSNDPYTNSNGGSMLSQNINTCNSVIGSSNYDIGHVYSTGGGGVAYLQSPCGSSKAGGVTGQGAPVGDPFDVDYVAHEMGHQYGGNHTQNNSCNRASSAAYEPGSASTIMGYAGICAPNLQSNSDDHFHNHSINEMVAFTVNGNGNTCASTSATGNGIPTVSGGVDGLTIPISTPFELKATGSDPDGDAVTYNWEQYDLGPSTATGDNNLTNPSGNQPIFRSFSSTTSPTRTFPRLQDLVNNTTTIGEHLPTYTRGLQFKCSIRDNRAGGGGFADDLKTLNVTANAGPFLVQAPNVGGTVVGNTQLPVSWDVAGTNGNGVNCTSVDIFLSTDGGYTFPTLLVAGTPNDGSASVLVPNVTTSQARIKVKASNNVFFDISNANFSITPGAGDIDYDLAIASAQGLNPGICESFLNPQVTVFNLGQQVVNAFTVTLEIDGGTPLVVNWTGTLGSGESVDVEFCDAGACVALADGAHVANASVQLTGASDEDLSNNDYTTSFETTSGGDVTMTVVTDNYPGETTWTVTDAGGETVWSGGPYATSGTSYSETTCLPYGCYTLTVNDSYGDGICCAYGQGSFELTSGGNVLASGGEFGATTSAEFCLDSPSLPGCTDPTAVNYNPQATEDDGSCIDSIAGCTNVAACNFNGAANVDDGSCTFPVQYYNCAGECNLDSDGDGVCDQLEVEGCQDDTACNYDATATDSGACFFPDPGFNCDGTSQCIEDLNDNNAVEVGDVLLVLADFGCTANCSADITGDGFVTVDDVLVLLSAFGSECL